uniref:Uncharacterized protein n=1 Tax=Knipowitschia caucasica TaxID=637954 RepID=A0AAV2L434_KNICA
MMAGEKRGDALDEGRWSSSRGGGEEEAGVGVLGLAPRDLHGNLHAALQCEPTGDAVPREARVRDSSQNGVSFCRGMCKLGLTLLRAVPSSCLLPPPLALLPSLLFLKKENFVMNASRVQTPGLVVVCVCAFFALWRQIPARTWNSACVELSAISRAHHVFVSSLQGDVATKHLQPSSFLRTAHEPLRSAPHPP